MAVTRSPTDEWTRQQLREATPWGKGPKYVIRDRDNKYGPLFSGLVDSSGIKELKTLVRALRANAICERFIGSLKRELDNWLGFNLVICPGEPLLYRRSGRKSVDPTRASGSEVVTFGSKFEIA